MKNRRQFTWKSIIKKKEKKNLEEKEGLGLDWKGCTFMLTEFRGVGG